MDAIDITDSAFALNAPTSITVGLYDAAANNPWTMYVLAALAMALAGVVAYQMYVRHKKAPHNDCDGGFCTMSDHEER